MGNSVWLLRWTAILETISFIALVGAMIAGSEAGVSVFGALHGLLFLAYVAALWFAREATGWSWAFLAGAVLTGPIGAIVVIERLRREQAPT